MKLLCLSNGHGEDGIAVQIVKELQQQTTPPEIAALPIVGEGRAYARLGIPVTAPVQIMPSGGFINTDRRQLLRDLQGGLVQLTRKQLRAIRAWARQGGMILAVGDIVPLLFAWFSGATYAFVATAKTEYYLRDEAGPLPGTWWRQPGERWLGSVYYPWEQWLMSHWRCKAVFPRDSLTTEILRQRAIPAFNLGNPMMDGLEPHSNFLNPNAAKAQPSLTVLLLPGSRSPEAYNNWQQLVAATAELVQQYESIRFLGAIAPSLSLEPLSQALQSQDWQLQASPAQTPFDSTALTFKQGNATLHLTRAFNDCLHQADLAIAMAGTATEQFVGLGKPAFIMPGRGPQFTPAFAEAQTRLLGPSVTLVNQPAQIAGVIKDLFSNPNRLSLIAENGPRRMGKPGAASRIATCLIEQLTQS